MVCGVCGFPTSPSKCIYITKAKRLGLTVVWKNSTVLHYLSVKVGLLLKKSFSRIMKKKLLLLLAESFAGGMCDCCDQQRVSFHLLHVCPVQCSHALCAALCAVPAVGHVMATDLFGIRSTVS